MRIRKITALATAAVMTVSSVLPVWAENPWGAESTPTAYSDVNISEDGFSYEVMEDGNIRITGKPSRTDEEKKIIIPEEIDGKKVTEIGSWAFDWVFEYVEEFILPDSLVKIGDGAFSDCKSLKKITISEMLTSIGDYAFSGCESLREITIPEGVTRIGCQAFMKCTSLQEITIPEGVTRISGQAFSDCTSLQEIILPKGLTEIGLYTFSGCTSLQEITIPDGVTSIDSEAFLNCNELKAINVNEKNINYSSVSGVLYDKECSSIIIYPEGKEDTEYSILETVKIIGYYSFSNNKKLEKIVIPEEVTRIENCAFKGSESLQEITIPEGVASIGREAFSGCGSLQEITIPEGVTSIGDRAFLKCENLKAINVDEKNENYSSVDGVLYDKECSRIIRYPEGKEDKEYIISGTVKTIGCYAFEDNKNLEQVVIRDGVTKIKEAGFYNCENMKKIYIPKSMESIECFSIGYAGEYLTYYRQGDVTIYGYKGTAAETYALEENCKFIAVMEAGDTDIKLEYNSDLIDGTIPEGTVKLDAKELQETDAEYGKIDIENLIKDETIDISEVKFTAYEIRLTDGDNKPVQPSGSITVKIPCPEGYDGNVCKVYYIDGEGKAMDMGAVYENGYMVFETNHFSTCIVTDTELKATVSVISGDANGDGEVDIKDAVMLKKHLAGYSDLKINLIAADTTGDGAVNINDAVRLLRYLAGDTVTLGK